MKFSKIFTLFVLATLLLVGTSSCGDENSNTGTEIPEPESPTVDLTAFRSELANNVATGIIIPAYQNLQLEVNQLQSAVTDFVNAPDEATLASAQTALKESWLAWQPAAIYMFGPSENVALRKSLNTYPVDADQINTNIESGDYILGSLANQDAIGFPALDYLLHSADAATTVAAFASAENAANRQKYLLEVTADIQQRVNQTLEGWLPEGGNYLATFTGEFATGIDVGSSLSMLVNSIDLHFQRFARDGKVAIPAGVRSAGVPRPRAVEALYAGYASELLIESLTAYERLFLGVNAEDQNEKGLYDYLVAIDAKNLADDIASQFTTTKSVVSQLELPLQAQIETDAEQVVNIFLEMQKLVVFFKADMASVMGVSITNQDNDGD